MNWTIPDLDPYITYAWKEVVRWTMANVTTSAIILAILSWLKVQAMKTENVIDDKIITLLIYVFTFSWLSDLQNPQRAQTETKEEDQMQSKQYTKISILLLAVMVSLLLSQTQAFAAGTASTPRVVPIGTMMRIISVTFKGDAADGSVPAVTLPDAIMADLKGYYLYSVRAYPVSGGTAPDPANVAVNNPRKDLLGALGVGLVPASGENEMLPYNAFTEKDFYPAIVDPLTIEVTGQGTPSADFTVDLIAVR